MKIIRNVEKYEKKIRACIEKYGRMPEHNYHYLKHSAEHGGRPVFFESGQFGILAVSYGDSEWYVISEPLAPEGEKIDVLFGFLDLVYGMKNTRRTVVEFTPQFRKKVLEKIKESSYHACRPYETLYWPVYRLADWSERMRGKEWKKLRNIKNKFVKQHKIEFVDSRKIPKAQLKKIVENWKEQRTARDHAYVDYFYNVIEDNFAGFDIARSVVIKGVPKSITAGWKIVNSNRYYSAIGLYEYEIDRLGEISNIDDLNVCKKKGYSAVDFGGSGKKLLEFKKKFRPEKTYKTRVFSIIRESDRVRRAAADKFPAP